MKSKQVMAMPKVLWQCPFSSGGFSSPPRSEPVFLTKAKAPTGDWIGCCLVLSSARCENPAQVRLPGAMLDELLVPHG